MNLPISQPPANCNGIVPTIWIAVLGAELGSDIEIEIEMSGLVGRI
jgi:hypothetical protein